MQTKTKILIGALVAGGIVVATQRKKIMALMSGQPVSGFGADAAPPVPLQQTAVTTQSVAQIVNTTVTSLAGIAGLALTMMTLTEKKRALNKA
jgi:hypothetical protein